MADDSGGGGGFTSHERIRDAALELFSRHGASSVTLRDVAQTAGVSVGLVQHYFGSKDRLIEAIDGHVLTVVATGLSEPLPESAPQAVDELGQRVHSLIAKHLREVDYFAQMIVTHSDAGSAFFDAMVEIIRSHWQNVADSSEHGAELDVTWAALNPLMLALGAIILRRHIDRQLPRPSLPKRN